MLHICRRLVPRLPAVVVMLWVAASFGCSKEKPTQPLPAESIAPNFSLKDVNPNSATTGQAVSPRSQLGKVSAWYFGHAT